MHCARAVHVQVVWAHLKIRTHLQVKRDGTTDPKLAGHIAYCANLKSIGGTIAVGCRLHAPEAENVFDEGSSGESETLS